MEYQVKSVSSSNEKYDIGHANTENTMVQGASDIQMNKTYDDCDPQKGLVSILIKIIPIAVYYLIFKFLSDQHLSLFVVTVILLAIDFWITKNILGPKLVGLKWYSVQDQDNNQKWCFASCGPNRVLSKVNVILFWIPQLIAIVFWFVIVLINIITLGVFWVGLAIFASILLIINFAFHLQCKGDHQQKVNFFAKKFGFEMYKEHQKLKENFQ